MRLDKVAAFITREQEQGRELLVIDHPTAGIQLPAGTAEEGEAPAAALLREVAEETGLITFAQMTKLAVFSQLQGQERVMRETTEIKSGPAPEAQSLPQIFRRGWYVRELVHRRQNAYVVYEEREHFDNKPGRLLLARAGWVPETAVTAHLVRHLYHLQPQQLLPDEWQAAPGDGGFQSWRLFWLPLATAALVAGQQAWLDRVRHHLLIGERLAINGAGDAFIAGV